MTAQRKKSKGTFLLRKLARQFAACDKLLDESGNSATDNNNSKRLPASTKPNAACCQTPDNANKLPEMLLIRCMQCCYAWNLELPYGAGKITAPASVAER
uniref:Uncharacterized protein n=1 Tax=Cacopsylla melanoneura TaxID=428564 RepID=A0A8D9E8D2_9HEMI